MQGCARVDTTATEEAGFVNIREEREGTVRRRRFNAEILQYLRSQRCVYGGLWEDKTVWHYQVEVQSGATDIDGQEGQLQR